MSEKNIKETALDLLQRICATAQNHTPSRAHKTIDECYLEAKDAIKKIEAMGIYSEIVPGSADDRLHSLELIASAAAELAETLLCEQMDDDVYECWCELGIHLRDAGYGDFEFALDREDFNCKIEEYLIRKGCAITSPKKIRTRPEVMQFELDSLTDSERLEVFGRYCRGCGCINFRDEHGQLCHCQNDE